MNELGGILVMILAFAACVILIGLIFYLSVYLCTCGRGVDS